jgi:hypothetical protein
LAKGRYAQAVWAAAGADFRAILAHYYYPNTEVAGLR